MVNKAKRSKPPKPGRNGVCNPGKISRIPFITLPDTVLERIFDNARVTFLRKNTQELAQIALGSPFKPGSIVNSAVSSVDGRLWRMPTIFLFLCRRCYAVAQQILLRHILLESEQAAGLFNTYINLNPHASAYISSLTLDGHDIPPSLIAPIIAKSSSVQQIQLWRLAKGVDSTAWSLSNLPPNHHSRPILQHLLIDCDPSSMLNGGSIRDLIAFLPPSSHLILVGFGIPFTMNARLASFPPFPSVRYLNITQSASNVTELADLIKGCSKHLESLEIKFPTTCSVEDAEAIITAAPLNLRHLVFEKWISKHLTEARLSSLTSTLGNSTQNLSKLHEANIGAPFPVHTLKRFTRLRSLVLRECFFTLPKGFFDSVPTGVRMLCLSGIIGPINTAYLMDFLKNIDDHPRLRDLTLRAGDSGWGTVEKIKMNNFCRTRKPKIRLTWEEI